MNFLISTAYAADAAPQGANQWMQFAMLAAMFAIFYFMLIRPQQKRMKEHRALIDSLTVGSEVVFAGGLMGKITKLDGEFAVIELNRNNEIKIQRASVISVLPEGTLNGLS